MLPDPDHIQPHLIRQLDLLQQILNPLHGSNRNPGYRIRLCRDETIDTDLHGEEGALEMVSIQAWSLFRPSIYRILESLFAE